MSNLIFILRKKTLAIFGLTVLGCAAALGCTLAHGALPAFLSESAANSPVIVIDAGHGGEDGGAVSADGVVESGINLAIAQELNELFRFLGCETKMTRTEDAAIYSDGAKTLREKKSSDLKNRAALVNGTPNAVLLSIHQNSLPASRSVHGAQVFYGGADGSRELADAIQSALNTTVNAGSGKSSKRIEPTIFLMKSVTCPAVLVECGFLSNVEETARLQDSGYQRMLAVTIAAGFLAGQTMQTNE